MIALAFNRNNIAYSLKPNGKVQAVNNGASTEGTWTAESSTEKSSITLNVGGQKTTIPVGYEFNNSDGNRNALKVVVPKDGNDPEASAIFPGSIELDDEKDITYKLPEGGAFVLYSKLSFDGSYNYLRVELEDGSKTFVRCSKPTIIPGAPGNLSKSTVLTMTALSRVGNDGNEIDAKIGVFGNLAPKDGNIIFMGSVAGDKTFDITLAGDYKMVNGALQISSKNGKVQLEATVRYKFDEGQGSWGVTLGHSDKIFKLSADLDFAGKKTGKQGETKLKGKAELAYDGVAGTLKIDFELEGDFEIGKDRALQFKLKGGIVNGTTTIAFSGKLSIDNKTVTAELNYAGKTISVQIAYETEKLKAAISFLKNGKDVGVRFYVSYTFGTNGEQKASQPKAA